VRNFLEHKVISNFIYLMVIILCIVIFTELSMGNTSGLLEIIFHRINFILLLFFVVEIFLRIFSEGKDFFMEFINVFDSTIVFISFGFNVSNIQAKALGILRVLRLVKVIIEMKKKADQRRAKKERIKEEKKKQT